MARVPVCDSVCRSSKTVRRKVGGTYGLTSQSKVTSTVGSGMALSVSEVRRLDKDLLLGTSHGSKVISWYCGGLEVGDFGM